MTYHVNFDWERAILNHPEHRHSKLGFLAWQSLSGRHPVQPKWPNARKNEIPGWRCVPQTNPNPTDFDGFE